MQVRSTYVVLDRCGSPYFGVCGRLNVCLGLCNSVGNRRCFRGSLSESNVVSHCIGASLEVGLRPVDDLCAGPDLHIGCRPHDLFGPSVSDEGGLTDSAGVSLRLGSEMNFSRSLGLGVRAGVLDNLGLVDDFC